MEIDPARLRADIEANGTFGALEGVDGHGRTVLCGSPANQAARERFRERMKAAGLTVRIDAVGNMAGRWTPSSADPSAAAVAAGSHLDSVLAGGLFDGPLGAYGALEAVRALREAGVEPDRPIEVVCFTEEEGGRFASGLLGSSVAAGQRSVEEALELPDENSRSLETALDEMGFRGESRLDASAWSAWVELHIEQGTRLEDAGVPVGVVTDIAGITHSRVRIRGEANHAGATPMGHRTDALPAAAELVLDIETAARDAVADTSETAVGTVGRIEVEPNATNVISGVVDLEMDVRDVNRAGIEAILEATTGTLERLESQRGVDTSLHRTLDLRSQRMSEVVRGATETAAENAGIDSMALHSGAAHDSMHVASVTEAGMLFAPSRDGISHSPQEWTDWADCAAATEVLAGTLAELAGAA
ncbi:MAG: M20 family metallo-hydrolase [Halobacteriales archaeon]